ncbi:DUF262 domain-containing protein [Flavobacterium terrigena]|uniref:DUF262 domain-containing protein n=1 Tax=Flavobacterium terrigena TaxID=402734 RepID=A0A1H6QUW4_9FLAO|nr:DUF262 domain-containing protein [Flavobacterium terrigena]SEI42752.1 Protein of unknown function [Flavobacterium terrigena]
MIKEFKSNKSSLAEIVDNNLQFNIPIYQRLYVWDNDIVKVFLTDLKNAFFEDNKKDYFIGSIVYVKNKDGIYDLIDGQQRNTTLWLISNVLGYDLDNFAFVNDQKMRLNFSIRKKVTEYFNYLRNTRDSITLEIFEDEEDLVNISKAFIQIKAFIENEENDLFDKKSEFATFIFNHVKLICTEVPSETDLTKLFEVINARGVQLRQDEILKAKLLAIINKDSIYKQKTGNLSKLWEACADMDGYVAFNLKNQLGNDITWKSLLNDEEINEETSDVSIKKFDSVFFKNFIEDEKHNSQDVNKPFSLASLLENDEYVNNHDVTKQYEGHQTISSIISFPMLLLHTLRIFLREHNHQDIPFFNEKKIISIFDDSFFKNEKLLKDYGDNMSKIVLDFLECLWNVKVIFDNNVVKWISSENEKELNFVKLYFTKNKDVEYPKLDKSEYDSFTALQAMLYHSQEMITQFWLTPYLHYHLKSSTLKLSDSFEYLRKLDNKLLSCTYTKGDLKERSLQLMINFNSTEKMIFNSNRFLTNSGNELGVKFPHYWFYKLEYVLLYQFFTNENFLFEFQKNSSSFTNYNKITHKELWKNYRITAKNSVEHISPQNPSFEKDKLCANFLNHFGNLALVTRSINSSYSNNAFDVKRIKFEDNLKKNRIDALKLYLIYQNWNESTWNDTSAEKHQNEMSLVLEKYFIENI